MVYKNNVVRATKVILLSILLFAFASAQNETAPQGQAYTIGLTQKIADLTATLRVIVGPLSLGLIILGGIVIGLAYAQPAETRGKWLTIGTGLIVGGVIMIAITLAAPNIQTGSENLLT